MGIYLPSDGAPLVLISVAGAEGIGAEPSPTITTPGAALVGAPLTAVMAPANIKLAKAPMTTFFTVRTLLLDELHKLRRLLTKWCKEDQHTS